MRGRIAAAAVALTAGIGLLGLPYGPGPAVAGDASVADTLFKSGKQAFAKGDFDQAATHFSKALDENSDLIEACWWKASAQEKSGKKGEALASYREFLVLFNGKSSAGTAPSKEEQRLKALADKSVDTLAAGEKEFVKLEDAYVASLLAFAKDNFVRDPGMSRKAVDAVLAVQPEHAEALKLNEKLGGSATADVEAPQGPSAAVGPFKDVKDWLDLIEGKWFGSRNSTFSGTSMFLDCKGGIAITPTGFIDTGVSFAFEYEFKVVEAYDASWVAGIGFASKDADFIAAMVIPGQIVLERTFADGTHKDLVQMNGPAVKLDTWHRLGILVKGPAVEVWYDGSKTLSWREPSGANFKGQLTMVQIKCRTESRLLRFGKVD